MITQVIYIMADNRSGSTLLENILSKSADAFSVGELAMLKGHILKEGFGERWNWNCSCGKPFTECTFWGSIVEETYNANAEKFSTKIQGKFKPRNLAFNAILPSLSKSKLLKVINAAKNRNAVYTLNILYNLVAEKSGKKFIIDSSKNPVQALAVYLKRKDYDVKVIWLKRDIRAISSSKSKWKAQNKKRGKSIFKQTLDVFYYRRLCYSVSQLIDKKDLLEMDYENLATNTHSELQRIFSAFDLPAFDTPKFMELTEDHTIAGTPNRFTKRPIQYDDEWKNQFKRHKLTYMAGGLMNKI